MVVGRVFHGEFAASRWQDSYSSALIESAVSNGATEWAWIQHHYGVVFEICLADEAQWERFRNLPAVRAALDAVPNPVNGLLSTAVAAAGRARPPAQAAAPRARARSSAGAAGRALPHLTQAFAEDPETNLCPTG